MTRFTCPCCGKASSHPQDLENGYCGACHAFTAEPAGPVPVWVGKSCTVCTLPIEAGERGKSSWAMTGPSEAEERAVHDECQMLGIVGHTFGICTCTGYDTTGPEARGSALTLAFKLAAMKKGVGWL